jgi:hypothetical protein
MVPQAEKWQTDGQHPTETGLDPFRGNYVFNTRVMGYDVSYETRAYFLRTTPLSFRGSRSKGDLDKLLSIAVWPGKDVRDFIRHLRLILHCGSFDEDLQIMALNILPDSLSIEEKTSIAESRVYDTYHSYLANISSLPFDKHTIKLEICILHGFISHPSLVEEYQRIERYKYNIFEAHILPSQKRRRRYQRALRGHTSWGTRPRHIMGARPGRRCMGGGTSSPT